MQEDAKYLTGTCWRTTRFSEGTHTLESLSTALGIALHINLDSLVRFDPHYFGYLRNVQQGSQVVAPGSNFLVRFGHRQRKIPCDILSGKRA